jgi:hypothetical protein
MTPSERDAGRPIAATEFLAILARHYGGRRDEETISVGHWDRTVEPPRFYADIRITVGEIRRMAAEPRAREP